MFGVLIFTPFDEAISTIISWQKSGVIPFLAFKALSQIIENSLAFYASTCLSKASPRENRSFKLGSALISFVSLRFFSLLSFVIYF